MANQKIYPRNLLILDHPYLAGFRNEHREYQALIGDLVVTEIVDFDSKNVIRLLITIESSRLQFLRSGNGVTKRRELEREIWKNTDTTNQGMHVDPNMI